VIVHAPTERRQAKVASIIAAAWDLARVNGIGGLSLHELARQVGMRQPSLYAYFDSKNGLYDAMFADGNRQLLDRLERKDYPDEPRQAVKTYMRVFVAFAIEDAARCALLFHRPIPGFEPSPESYALAERALGGAVDRLHQAGLTDPGDVDCVIAMVAGLIDAQNSNDPGGDRWTRHLDRLIDLHLDDALRRKR
jgi:AcrR family transcriptional regulator